MKKKLIDLHQKFLSPAGYRDEYRKLKAHLNRQPVGYPSTLSGVENRLLTNIFTPKHALTALYLTSVFEPLETIHERAKKDGIEKDELLNTLNQMDVNGCIFLRYRDSKPCYALHPHVVGMFEAQVTRLTPGYYLDALNYGIQGFGMEYLNTKLPQMRVIPVRKSIQTELNVATYDEVRSLVENSQGAMRLVPCVCKAGKDLLNDPCKKTKRREVCLILRDFAAVGERHGWGREATKEEALEMLDESEKEGLMLMPSNMLEPQVICSCCGCCCGITAITRSVPRPADFTASNFFAELDFELCNGCKKCVKRCHMKAMVLEKKTKKPLKINPGRCVGCGVCISSCKQNAIKLQNKPETTIPPKDHDELYEAIAMGKKGFVGKSIQMAKAMAGFKKSS
jgi:electron transport complex protein RnfB